MREKKNICSKRIMKVLIPVLVYMSIGVLPYSMIYKGYLTVITMYIVKPI